MMSNIINNTTNSVSSTSSGYGTSRGVEDICLGSLISSPTQASPYDKIIDMIKGLDLQDDGILMNHKIKSIEIDFCNIVRDENMLSESMDYINHKALSDGDTSLKFALLFSSRNFDSLAMNDTKVRSKMLKILEQNYQSAEIFRIENKDRLYNSITLLGEYYHRVRLADNVPIAILGESLLGLLIREICENDNLIDIKLARLILSQITLNGDIMRVQHMDDLTQLLYHVRRNLIEQPSLQPNVKALLLMTLDLYYSNFSNLGHQLEEMYTKYLVDESNNNSNINSCDDTADETENLSANDSFQNATGVVVTATAATDESQIASYENGCGSSLNDSISGDLNTSEPKKWSEQVCEESFLEHEYCNNQFTSIEDNNSISSNNQLQQQQYQNNNFQQNIHQQETTEFNSISGVGSGGVGDEKEFYVNAGINSFHPHSSQQLQPQQSNQHQNQYKSFSPDRSHSSSSKQNRSDVSTKQSQQPRWRIPRFNRGSSEQDERFMSNSNNNRHNNRRLSGNFDDDHNSVRSEGGSIRLYSVNDRLKHLQDKIEREPSSHNHHHHHHHGGGGGNHYHSNSSNSWDHGRNFDRNNRNRGSGNGGGRGNFRHTYNRPPRFMKKNNQLSSMDGNNGGDHHHPPPQQQPQQWRSSSGNNASTMSSSYHEDESYATTVNNGGTTNDSHSRSSSRARTLPRPPKTNYNDKNNRRSQSPIYNNKMYNNDRGYNNNSLRHHGKHFNNNDNNQQQQQHYRPQQSRNFNHRNPRYSSQSSLASETSSTLDRRHLRRNYLRHNNQQQHQQHQHQQPDNNATTHDWEDTHSLHGQPEESNWNSKDNNRELVLNARNTTKYMNYLSQK